MAAKLFIIKATATAAAGSGQPAGQRHPILAFVRAEDDAQSAARFPAQLAAQGWTRPQVTQADEADLERITDPKVRAAAERAAGDVCGVVVFPALPAKSPVKWV